MADNTDEMASGPKREHTNQDAGGAEIPAVKEQVEIVTISPQDVLKSGGNVRPASVTLGTFTQVAGLRLAAGVGALAAVVTIALVARALWMLPVTPQLTSQMTKEQVDALMSAQKQNYDLVLNAMTTLFEAVIVKVLLPVFTSILGYIFGAQMSRGSDGKD